MKNQLHGTTARVVAAAIVAASTALHAELLVYEPFDYPDAPLNGQGGALGTTGTWTTNDTGEAQGWWCHPEGEVTGQGDDFGPGGDALNLFDGTVDNLATAGGFAGPAGPEDQTTPGTFGTRDPTGNLDANIGLDPGVTATFVAGNTTWFSYVGCHADNRNAGSPTFMLCTDPTTNGSRGLAMMFDPDPQMDMPGNGIGGVGGPTRFNLFDVYPHYFSGGVHHQTPGGYQDGVFGNHNGIVSAFCSTPTCNGVLDESGQPRTHTMAWAVRDADGFMGVPNIVVGKIEWDADDGGYDIITVVRFLETEDLSEAAFDALVAATPALSSKNWQAAVIPADPANPSNKPNLDQSQFDTLNISSLKFWVDEIRVGTTFADVTPEPPTPPRIPLTITPNPGGGYDLEWDSTTSLVYNIRSSTDLADPGSTWPIVEPDIPGEVGSTIRNVTPADPSRFYLVESFPPPPVVLLSEDFEAGDGGFTVVTTAGTAWENGSPDSNSPGGEVTAGNTDSTLACWGTGLGPADMGQYVDSTVTCLRSTVIDLTGFAEAELVFAEALDLEAGDTAVVNIIDDTTDTVIAAAIYTATDGNNTTANWNSVGPIAIPAAALGQAIRIEWCLTGFGGSTNDYLGWYIDDVEVTGSGP